jgi:hypothetical protein
MSDHKKSEQAQEIIVAPAQTSIQGTPAAQIQAAPDLHPLLQAALATEGLSVEKLEKMQEIQFRHEANEARKAYTKAKVALMSSLPPIIAHDRVVDYPSSKGGRVHYSYATMAAAVKEIQPKLGDYGFSYQWIPENLPDWNVKITFRLTHVLGHFEDFPMSGPPDTAGGKDPLKAIGSTSSYLKRYTFCLGFGVTTADMKDSDDHAADRSERARNERSERARNERSERIDRAATNKAVAYIEANGMPLERRPQSGHAATWTSSGSSSWGRGGERRKPNHRPLRRLRMMLLSLPRSYGGGDGRMNMKSFWRSETSARLQPHSLT